ncbi:MAG: AraC family transcriptional regulator [Dysgonamonadaceae bacterium]|nr:AraC family transcriptional regulator [Dysgonamonadaceae bacterium]MDD3355356.1 AraC family transcriptional regulator [Dysgonamonadaceae bacterium]MDD4246038.1 AraC family transcriptional regulator [Dysgonamonadaceae bacterium]MDD4604955.1 AraC family transcriptional regulator [Dysgonamonadaceae bacterium]
MSINTDHIIKEITRLSDKDCFYIVDRRKTEFTYPLHSHDEYELNYVENASGVKRIVGDSVEIIGNYDLALIAGEDLEHVWDQHKCESKNIREITIQFSSDLFFGNFIHKNQFDSIRRMLEKAKKGISFPMEGIMKIYPMLDTLTSEKEGFYSVIKFLSILYELSLIENTQTLASSSFAKIDDSTDSRRVRKIYDYINEHYTDQITLDELANLIGMTPVALSRFFKLRSGRTISDYIIDIRLGNATRLLVDTTNSISEICYESGFNNLSNFNRVFKRKKECSPTEFRENFRKTKIIV